VADSADKLKRARGRRGLDVLNRLRAESRLEVKFFDVSHAVEAETVDHKLVRLGKELGARVVTSDYNLNKVAQLDGVDVVNINDLAAAMKPALLPGEKMTVRIVRGGEEQGQGVGFLDDGTMVVVEQARQRMNDEVEIVVSRALQTSAGRMVFAKLAGDPPSPARRSKSQIDEQAAH